jgi:hypothetical protein
MIKPWLFNTTFLGYAVTRHIAQGSIYGKLNLSSNSIN